jgi:threonine/homoserine/homoserine lactone efflux protein
MIHRLILVLLINVLAAMSPGPDFAIVLNNTLKKGRFAGIATSLGIFCALFIHCSYCSLGLTHLIVEYPLIMKVVSVAGGLYLFYMGAMIIKNRHSTIPGDAITQEKTENTHASFIQGFLTCLLNPKVVMFMIALFTTVIKPTSIAEGYLFTAFMIIPALLWFIVLSYILTMPKTKEKIIHFQHHILMVMGLILIAIGCVVLVEFIMTL